MRIYNMITKTYEDGDIDLHAVSCTTRELACKKMQEKYDEWVDFYGEDNVDADIDISEDFAEAHVYSEKFDEAIELFVEETDLIEEE